MRRIIGIGVVLTLLSCNNNSTEKPAGIIHGIPVEEFISYTDKTNGFRIDYPATWVTTKMDSRVIFMAIENDPDTADQFNEIVNLTIMSNEGMTLDAIAEQNIKTFKEYYGDAEIKSAKKINDNGVDFINFMIVQEAEGLKLVSFATFFTKEDRLYTLSQTAEEKKLAKYEPLYQHIINSFGWTLKN